MTAPIPPGAGVPARTRFTEVGAGGVRRSGGYIAADFRPELWGARGAQQYTEMRLNDPVIFGMLHAIDMLVRGVTWRVEPARPDPDQDPTLEAKAIAAWVEREITQEIETPWPEVVSDAFTMLPYGYAPLEIVWARRDDGRVGLRKLALRAQATVTRWDHDPDTGAVRGLYQQTDVTPEVFIPLDKVLLFRTTAEAGNPEGRSLLRGAYVYYLRKKAIEEAEGRAALRGSGVVTFYLPENVLNPQSDDERATLAAYRTLADQLAADTRGAILLPSTVDPTTKVPHYRFEYTVADGRRSADYSPLIERMDRRIAGTVLADFMILGGGAGSYALSKDKTDLFELSLKTMLGMVAGEMNGKLVPRWGALNAWPRDLWPKLVPGPIAPAPLAAVGSFVASLAGAGHPVQADPKLDAHLRELAGLPVPAEAAKPMNAAAEAMRASASAQAGATAGAAAADRAEDDA